jgi:hypothetical protein
MVLLAIIEREYFHAMMRMPGSIIISRLRVTVNAEEPNSVVPGREQREAHAWPKAPEGEEGVG